MRLSTLLEHVSVLEVHGNLDVEVNHVTRDSRNSSHTSIFVAIAGAHVDGHDFLNNVEAIACVVERAPSSPLNCPWIRVQNTKEALAILSAALHSFPGKQFPIVGVTGTNGKTTVTTLVEQALSKIGWRVGRIGTTGLVIDGREAPATLTTPESTQLQAVLHDMVDRSVQVAVMEVSSIGLVQHRVDGIDYALGVFTNLSRDHLDFHHTMEEYRHAKSRLFRELLRPRGGVPRALLWADDPQWQEMQAPSDRWLYGFDTSADIRILDTAYTMLGTEIVISTPLGSGTLKSKLLGRHNALNMACALGICLLLGAPLEDTLRGLSEVEVVAGRLEPVPNNRELLVLVDYAHTEDALGAVLGVVRELVKGQVWVVFGCGGERDEGKRANMGKVADTHADRTVVTSDNPRGEDPQGIIDAVVGGMPDGPTHIDVDREQAIRWVLENAKSGDAVLIAGKGHETYQERDGVKRPFDDREVILRILSEVGC